MDTLKKHAITYEDEFLLMKDLFIMSGNPQTEATLKKPLFK